MAKYKISHTMSIACSRVKVSGIERYDLVHRLRDLASRCCFNSRSGHSLYENALNDQCREIQSVAKAQRGKKLK